MDLATPSKMPFPSIEKNPSSSSPTSSLKQSLKATAPLNDQIWTPEKPAQPPLRARNRGVAFSVREVKQVAHGLRKPATDRSDLSRSDNGLSSLEAQLRAGSGGASAPKPSKAKNLVKLPEKYEALCEFFNCMESSIRLLRLKGSMSTFANICTSIQHLTERRFTYAHLAQLKYLMPEAILVKKVLLHDEITCCMKPELQVSLDVEAIVKSMNGKCESGFLNMRKVFRERLVAFCKDHPQGDEVPEEQLPHPFNQTKHTVPPNVVIVKTNTASVEPSSDAAIAPTSIVPSHMSQSFQKRFARKIPIPDSQKTPLMSFIKVHPENDHSDSVASSPMKCNSKPPMCKKSFMASPVSLDSSRCRSTAEETANFVQYDNGSHKEMKMIESTPTKLLSTPLRLMTATPEITAMKSYGTSISCDTPMGKKSAKRSTRTKLFTTPTKRTKVVDEEHEGRSSSADGDVLNILPESLLQSIREKEKKATEERGAGVDDAIRRQKMIASLTTTFDMILLIFQSHKRSVMTKHELIHKLISSHSRIVDKGEVEEQLKLLQELVPDWISEKTAFGGDILCRVNTISSSQEIRQRLREAE